MMIDELARKVEALETVLRLLIAKMASSRVLPRQELEGLLGRAQADLADFGGDVATVRNLALLLGSSIDDRRELPRSVLLQLESS